MVGFYGGSPLESAAIVQQGTEAVPASSSEVLGAAFGGGLAANLTPRLWRAQRRAEAFPTVGPPSSPAWAPEPDSAILGDLAARDTIEPLLDPETANSEYGIKGVLSFDAPIPRSVASDLYEHKRAQIEREDTIARREGSLLTGGAARFTASMVAGLLDPINVAAGFIPFVGEARMAQTLGRGTFATMGAGERAGVRALTGAGQGAAAMTALQPLEFGLSRGEREDYTMADALRSIALGTMLGGGLHAGVGAALDRATGRYSNPLTQAVEEAGPDAREALLRGSVAQVIEGRPVDIAPALEALREPRIPDEGARWQEAEGRRIGFDRNQYEAEREASAFDPNNMFAGVDAVNAARREPLDELSARIDADEAMAQQSDDLRSLHQKIADLEQQASPPRPIEQSADRADQTVPVEQTVAQVAHDIGESRAAAVERAAFCITRGGG